jgi:GTP pyrophosphokinase
MGKAAVDGELKRFGTAYTEAQRNEIVENVGKRTGFNSADDVYNTLGYGGLAVSKIAGKLRDEFERLIKPEPIQPAITEAEQVKTAEIHKSGKSRSGVIVDGASGCSVKFAKCCNPLPGDSIVGFITKGYGVSIHKRDCPNAVAGLSQPEQSERWIDANWEYNSEQNSEIFEAMVQIIAQNSITLIAEITMALADMKVSILQINSQKRPDDSIIINLKIGCKNIEHYKSIVSRLRSLKNIEDVRRGFA